MKTIDVIANHSMFQDLSTDAIQAYLNEGSFLVHDFGKRQIIHIDGDPCQTFDIILEGQVVIDRIDDEGNLLSIVTFSKGDTIGGNVLYSRRPKYLMTISAKSPVTLLSIKKEAVTQLLESNRHFLFYFIGDISDRATILGQRIRRFGTKSLRTKLVDYLSHEQAKQKTNPILLPVSKKALSEQLGVVRTSISRELKAMEDDGLITVQKKIITIRS